MIALAFVQEFTRTGFGTALIQRKGDIESYLDTTWTILFARGLTLGLVLFFGAGIASNILSAPEAKPMIQAIALSFVIRGLANPGVFYIQKDLVFHKQFILKTSQAIIGLLLPIPLALLWHNAWALVVGVLAGDLCSVILSYILHSYRPRFRFDMAKAKQLQTTGKWFFLTTVIFFISTQVDKTLVSNMLGPTLLGLYQEGLIFRSSQVSQSIRIPGCFPGVCQASR
jgi:PST family polysaccharide transporter/lipopolysaccharide exporter